jgi:glycosyltransferase involved in cell wall biosynthesis
MFQRDEIIVSICMITYNHSKFIENSLKSALNQKCTFTFEIIICDDASTDNTVEIINNLINYFPNKIKLYVNQINIGATKNLAKAISLCKGKYICILEGDDYWLSKNKIENQVNFLNHNLDCNTCFTKAKMVDRNDNFIIELPLSKYRKSRFEIVDLIKNDVFMPTCTTMFRANSFNYFPDIFYTLKNGCDWVLSILNTETGKIGFLDEIHAVYRSNSSEFAWSSNPIHKIYPDAIIINKAVDEYFNYKYHEIIIKKIIRYYFWLCKDLLIHKKFNAFFKETKNSFDYPISLKFQFTLFFYYFPINYFKFYFKKLIA